MHSLLVRVCLPVCLLAAGVVRGEMPATTVRLSPDAADVLVRLKGALARDSGRSWTDAEIVERALAGMLDQRGHEQRFVQRGNHQAVVRVEARYGELSHCGTGTLVAVDADGARGLVLTAAHIVAEEPDTDSSIDTKTDNSEPTELAVLFPFGAEVSATLVQLDHELDLAALEIAPPAGATFAPLSDQAPALGETVSVGGYGMGDYRFFEGRVLGWFADRLDGPRESIGVLGTTVSGDSGGPIFNEAGEVVAVHWGMQGTGRRGSDTFPIRGTGNNRIVSWIKGLGENYRWARRE